MASAPQSYPVRHPVFILTYSGKNITADITRMVIEIELSEGNKTPMMPKIRERGAKGTHRKIKNQSDELTVTVEDRDKRWQNQWHPKRGETMSVQLGYAGEGLTPVRSFEIDELALKGPPDTFEFKCVATGVKQSLRTPRSVSYENHTLMTVAQAIAARHNLTLVGAPADINVQWTRLTQRHETDLHFLHNLAADHGYNFSVRSTKNGPQLIFHSLSKLESAAPIYTITRGKNAIETFEFAEQTDNQYAGAEVSYHNPATKQLIKANDTAPSAVTGDTLHVVTRVETVQQALLKAKSALHDANMYATVAKLKMEGTPTLMHGVNVTIQGFGQYSGTYHIDYSRHRLDRSGGYTTEIELRKL